MYSSFIHKGQSWHREKMLTTNQIVWTSPAPIAPNVRILTSAPTAVSMGIMLICPEEAPQFIKTETPIHILWLPPACSTTSQHFHLPPCSETHEPTFNISLNTANLNVINISSPEFRIWQHLEDHWNGTQLHHLVKILSVPIDQLFKLMVSSNGPITPFISTDESIGGTVSIWTLFSHTGINIMAIGSLIPAGLGILCCYFFWCWPARLACWPLQSDSTWYTIVDDNVQAALIYRCNGKAGQHIVRPHENHVLHMEWEPTQTESQQKQQTQSKAVPASRSLDRTSKILEHNKHIWSVVRFRFGPVAASLNSLIDLLWRTITASYSTTTTCGQLIINQETITLSPLKKHMQNEMHQQTKGHMPLTSVHQSGSIKYHLNLFTLLLSDTNINSEKKINLTSFSCSTHLMYITKISSMDATHYWPFAREYSIWNATVAALQFWTEDLETHILSDATERVYTAFFCSNSAQQLRNISEEVLFIHFMTTLNNTFEWELAQEDEGYEIGTESLNVPTPLQRAPCLCHVSASENLCLDPATPLTTAHPAHSPQSLSSHNPVCHQLMFS